MGMRLILVVESTNIPKDKLDEAYAYLKNEFEGNKDYRVMYSPPFELEQAGVDLSDEHELCGGTLKVLCNPNNHDSSLFSPEANFDRMDDAFSRAKDHLWEELGLLSGVAATRKQGGT